jgi:hypothetical protein
VRRAFSAEHAEDDQGEPVLPYPASQRHGRPRRARGPTVAIAAPDAAAFGISVCIWDVSPSAQPVDEASNNHASYQVCTRHRQARRASPAQAEPRSRYSPTGRGTPRG